MNNMENKAQQTTRNENRQIRKMEDWKKLKNECNFSEIASNLIVSTEMKDEEENRSFYKSKGVAVFSDKTLILEDKYTFQLLESFNFNESVKLISAIEDSDTFDGADSHSETEEMVTDFVINHLEAYKDINLELLQQLRRHIASSSYYEKKSKIFIKSVSLVNNVQDWIFVNDNLLNSEVVDYCIDEDITDIIDVSLHPEAFQVYSHFKRMENKYKEQIAKTISNQLSTLPRFTRWENEIFFNKLKKYPYVFPHFYQTLALEQQEILIDTALFIDPDFWSKDKGFNYARDLFNAQKRFNQQLAEV